MGKDNKTFLIGRDARTGHLTSVDRARQYPNTHVVERMPKAGNGDTNSNKKR